MANPDNLPRPKSGDVLTEETLNAFVEALSRAEGITSGGGGINVRSTAAGTPITHTGPPEHWIRLTADATGGEYDWVELIPDVGGAWIDGDRTGSATVSPVDPAIEANHTAGLPVGGDGVGTVVYARRDARGQLRFQHDRCS